MTLAWILVRWARDYGDPSPMDVVCWMPPEPGVPNRCLCGYGFPPATPKGADWIECEGPFRHVWRDALVEIGQRIRVHETAAMMAVARGFGESGRSTSAPTPEPSTGEEDKTPTERPDSNKSGRSSVVHEGGFTLAVREVPACTTCGRVGHLAADCPNEGGSRGQA